MPAVAPLSYAERAQLFAQLAALERAGVPLLQALVGGSLGAGAYLWGVLQPLLCLTALWLLLRWSWRRQQAAARPNAWLGRVPLIGPVVRRRNLRDFCESLGLLLEAGVPMLDALPKALATLDDAALRHDFGTLLHVVRGGHALAQAMQPLEFPGKAQLAALVRSGEASGTLPATLLGYAEREIARLADLQRQLATWLPRLAYLLVALWMAQGLLGGAALLSAAHR
ncbi:MAG: type II secretion system F family protein [Pseudomonadaceae bacterium]|nr:type II secretion system F family protein [Pseudomonadaceae bacterium]